MPILNMVGGGKKGGNIGEPLNLTVTTSGLDATITWEDNEIGTIPPTTFQKSELVRKIGSAPTSPSDGDLVVTETVKDAYKTTGYVDQGLTDGETYYYRVFSYSDLGGISYCDAVNVTPSSHWQPGVNTKVYYNINDNDTNTTIYDLSGNGIDQTWSGTPGYTTDATYGRVATFNGSSYTQASSVVNLGNNITIIALFKTNYTSRQIVYSQGRGSGLRPVGMCINAWGSGKYEGVFYDGYETQSATSATANTWIMLAITCDGNGNRKIYVNGQLDGSRTTAVTPHSTGTGPTLGQWGDDTGYLNGQIKLIIGEDRTRTDQEIADLASEYGF